MHLVNSKTSLLDEHGDLHAKIGSREWAVAVVRKICYAISQMDSDAESAGRWLKLARDRNAAKAMGHASFGLMLLKECKLDTEFADALINAKPGRTVGQTVAELAAEAEPLGKHGGDRKPDSKVDISTLHGIRDADYLTRRIARDFPEILERMKNGEFKSVRAAAKEAGIVKDPTGLQLLQRAYNKATEGEWSQFLEWIEDDEKTETT